MFDAFVDWLKLTISATTYAYSRGMWVESPALDGKHIAAVRQAGGQGPNVDDRRQRYQLILLGPRNDRAAAPAIAAAMESLMQAALGSSKPCGAASVRAIGEPMGAGYTNENRAWYSLDFEVLF